MWNIPARGKLRIEQTGAFPRRSHWVAILKRFPFWLKDLSPSFSSCCIFFRKEIARRVAERNELAGGEDAVDEAKVNTRRLAARWAPTQSERDGISQPHGKSVCTYTESIHTYKHMHCLYSLCAARRRALSGHSKEPSSCNHGYSAWMRSCLWALWWTGAFY